MAAGILSEDTMFSARNIRPWHGLGTVIDTAPTAAEAIKLAGLDWKVEQKELKTVEGVAVPGYFANIRNDSGTVLGVVKGKYQVVQNEESFAFVDDLLGMAGDCRFETAGSLYNGKRTWMLVRMPEQKLLGDQVENYLFFMNSHDGSSGITAGVSSVRVVCNNTLQFATSEAGRLGRLWHVTHTGDIKGKLAEARLSLKLATEYVDQASQTAVQMAAKKVNEEMFFRNLFATWYKDATTDTVTKICNGIHEIYHNKEDLQNFKGTAWGLWNAVADYESNRKKRGNGQGYMNSFLTGNEIITVSQKILMAA